MSLKLYNPNFLPVMYNNNAVSTVEKKYYEKIAQKEKDMTKKLSSVKPNKIPSKISLELFILNQFLRNLKPNQQLQSILQKIYGIGKRRAIDLVMPFTYMCYGPSFKSLTLKHKDLLVDLVEESSFTLKDWLKNIKKTNIARVKTINCYKGVRHTLYLPVRGQRTHSNAHVARYLSSGTFDYVPKTPSTKNKRLSKYSRRKDFILDASNARYNRLLNKNYVEFAKNNKKLFKQLIKKNKLGVFGKLYKEKQKIAKDKAKKSKKKIK
jgi:small subunit ribosomal protein S13